MDDGEEDADGDEEGDARLARRRAGQRGSSVNDGDAVLAAFLGGGGPPPRSAPRQPMAGGSGRTSGIWPF